MKRLTLIAAAVAALTLAKADTARAEAADLNCVGRSTDGAEVYVSNVYFDDASVPKRIATWRLNPRTGWEFIGDFTTFEDRTPTHPSDVFYYLIFRADDAVPGDRAVQIMAGGFTQMATVQVIPLGEDDPQALATMQCNG